MATISSQATGTQRTIMNLAEKRKFFIEVVKRRARPGSGSAHAFLQLRTAMYRVPNLQAIIQQTRFVIVGGVATRLYMPERMTQDVVILVLEQDATLLYQELRQAGCVLMSTLSVGGTNWRLPDGGMLDVLVSDEPWVPEALQTPAYTESGQPVIDLPYLVVMKLQSGRAQDIADITRMLGGGDERALQRVRDAVNAYVPDATDDVESLMILGRLEYGIE